MAKLIKMKEQDIEQLKEEFADALRKMKMSEGKVSYTKDFGSIDRKATLYYTEVAWLKQCMLINEFDKEVAWHGIAKRTEEENAFIIEDIIVYPQEVTGSTVNTDQEKYQTWLYQHPDEVFFNIRMQGHSHVNMTTSPSSVDTDLYKKFLDQLDDTMFYIFVIFNKKGDKTIKIYDLRENVLYETADVDLQIIDNEYGFGEFIKNAEEMVQTKTYQYTPPAQTSKPAATQTTKTQESTSRMGKKKNSKYSGYSGGYYDNWSERWEDDKYYRGW